MKLAAFTLAGVSVALLGAVAADAQTAAPKKDSVNDYLCTFAGKCGGDAPTEATPTMAAPATKGFRLAAPQASPTVAAPATKGFRLAAPQQGQPAAQPTSSAPLTRGFRLATAPAAKPAATAPAKPMRPRHMASAAMAPAPGKTHANLQLAFELNSDQLTSGAQERAKTFAQALMSPELKDKRFLIEGHTDSRGSREANIDLSRRRAQAVADFLVKQGVDTSRIEVKGVGPDEPLPNHSKSAEANRRVEAVLLS